MLRLICPKCQKDSYSAGVESFNPCPYCGTKFSGTYGLYTRCEERIKHEIPFVFPYQGGHLEATTVDFSERGLGIKILGEPSIVTGDTIEGSPNIFMPSPLSEKSTVVASRCPP